MPDFEIITKTLSGSLGGDESSSLELEVNTMTGKAELVITRTIRERMPVQEMLAARELFQYINRSGRSVPSLKKSAQ